MQDLLTSTIELIFFSFAIVMAFDFVNGLRCVSQPVQVHAQIQSRPQTEPEAIAQRSRQRQIAPRTEMLEPLGYLPDPWTLPVDEVPAIPQKPVPPAQPDPKPLLLLPQAKESNAQGLLSTSVKPTLDELLMGVDIDTLKLRPARKIASALGVAQKVNRRDLPLEWLRAQIKKRLEQTPTETAQVIAEVLKAS